MSTMCTLLACLTSNHHGSQSADGHASKGLRSPRCQSNGTSHHSPYLQQITASIATRPRTHPIHVLGPETTVRNHTGDPLLCHDGRLCALRVSGTVFGGGTWRELYLPRQKTGRDKRNKVSASRSGRNRSTMTPLPQRSAAGSAI